MCIKTLLNRNYIKNFRYVYINTDMHAGVRREHGRIRQVLKAEQEKAENQGRNVSYDHASKTVLVDGIVVNRFQPKFVL